MSRSRTAAIAYAVLAAADTVLAASAAPRARRLRLITKPLLMPALAVSFAETTAGKGGVLRTGTLVAQGFSGAGDVALLRKGDSAFLAGLSAFFVAHIAYVGAFASAGRPLRDRSSTAGVKGAAVMWATTGPVMAYAAGRKAPALRIPVAAYSGILSAMFATSSRLDPSLSPGARRTVLAGTALFLASDTILGSREFLLRDAGPATDAAVMATYTGGQALIAAGVARALDG